MTQRLFTSVTNSVALLASELFAPLAGTTEILIFGIHSVVTERTGSCSASFELQCFVLFLFLEKGFLGVGASSTKPPRYAGLSRTRAPIEHYRSAFSKKTILLLFTSIKYY